MTVCQSFSLFISTIHYKKTHAQALRTFLLTTESNVYYINIVSGPKTIPKHHSYIQLQSRSVLMNTVFRSWKYGIVHFCLILSEGDGSCLQQSALSL